MIRHSDIFGRRTLFWYLFQADDSQILVQLNGTLPVAPPLAFG